MSEMPECHSERFHPDKRVEDLSSGPLRFRAAVDVVRGVFLPLDPSAVLQAICFDQQRRHDPRNPSQLNAGRSRNDFSLSTLSAFELMVLLAMADHDPRTLFAKHASFLLFRLRTPIPSLLPAQKSQHA